MPGICVINRIIIGSDNGLSPIRRQAKYKTLRSRNCILKYRLRNGGHFVQRNNERNSDYTYYIDL